MTDTPSLADIVGNDWRALEVGDAASFVGTESVTVVISYFEAHDKLELTLAALARQTYPRKLVEVIVVDDGSIPPLETPVTDLDLRVVHQEDRGFGLARARNTGAAAASHEILLFLDCDMLPEAGWLAAHARWHHAVADAVTLGFRAHVDVTGVSATSIEQRSGSLAELLADRPIERPEWIEYHMARTNDLTSADDDVFRVVTGGNLGVRRSLFNEIGRYDESFTQWGAEDTEFGYRAYTAGAVLIPERAAFCVHQGLGTTPDDEESQSLEHQRAKISHLIAHRGFRRALPGRSFVVPQFLVVVESEDVAVGEVLETAEQVLANRVHDLEVWITPRSVDPQFEWLRRQLDPDPRVQFGDLAQAVAAQPAASFHVSIPAGARLREYAIGNLRTELGDRAGAVARLTNGSAVSITRAWAAHRARRSGRPLSDVIEIAQIDWRDLGIRSPGSTARGRLNVLRRLRDPDSRTGRVLRQMQRIRRPAQAWRFGKWAMGAARQQVTGSGRPASAPSLTSISTVPTIATADYPLGAEIVARGPVAVAVFRASSRVSQGGGDQHIDVVVADRASTIGEADSAPAVVLDRAAPMLSVPAFDPRTVNPIRWVRDHDKTVASLGPLEKLPDGAPTGAVIDANEVDRLRYVHHVEDVAGFHATVVERAGTLARLVGQGVVVHVADDAADLKAAIGEELYELMRSGTIRSADHHDRESLSIKMRRLAHRDHTLRSRARSVIEVAGLAPRTLPAVSILLATNRPDYLDAALAAVSKQSYPNVELVLALHGGSFTGAIEARAAEISQPVRVVRVAHELTLGDALNTAVSAASGRLLTKFDDDDLYSVDHVWDLVLAHAYSGAELIAKAAEYVYLERSDKTIHRFVGRGETFSTTLAGGTMLISREALAEAGGWRRIPRSVDRGLIDDVERVGGLVYRTHGAGYILVRHGRGHTWASDDAYFLDQAQDFRDGLDESFADV